jgi:serine protease Do
MGARRLVAGLMLGVLTLPAVAQRQFPDFSALVAANAATVVNIGSARRAGRSPDALPPGHHDAQSLGSGFIISDDGYILTCAHVVEGVGDAVVRLADRRELPARVIGADRRSDVALLKIEAHGLSRVTVGDPARLKVGEWVLAIGSPFGFESSATAGIVSAKGRNLPQESYVPFIQTDVAINPGNSGGPLFNLRGEVVGVNSQIYSRTGGFMGLSFAVPIDIAMQVVAQLKAEGRVRRGWLGVTLEEVAREPAGAPGTKRPSGAQVTAILPDGPAARSELQPGDVVVEFEGSRVQRPADLPPLVARTPIGTRVRLGVLRQGTPRTVVVAVGELPEEPALEPVGRAPAP